MWSRLSSSVIISVCCFVEMIIWCFVYWHLMSSKSEVITNQRKHFHQQLQTLSLSILRTNFNNWQCFVGCLNSFHKDQRTSRGEWLKLARHISASWLKNAKSFQENFYTHCNSQMHGTLLLSCTVTMMKFHRCDLTHLWFIVWKVKQVFFLNWPSPLRGEG